MFYIVLRQNLKSRAEWPLELLQDHLKWADTECASGSLVLSGPGNAKSMGIYLIKAADLQAARTVTERDPIIHRGFCTYDIYDWDIQRGAKLLPS